MIGKVMEAFMERAPKEFSAACPCQGQGADLSKHPGAEKQKWRCATRGWCRAAGLFAAAASLPQAKDHR